MKQAFFDNNKERYNKIVHHLQDAMEKNEFFIEYQPIVDVYKKEVIGLEALLRWDNEELGYISPQIFIPIAEQCKQIVPIGEWVFETVCKQRQKWLEEKLPNFFLSVNMSLIQFHDEHVVKMIMDKITKYNLSPKLIKLEITESTAMSNVEDTLEKLQAMEACGVEIFLDDFGTGYSSLSHLAMLPISTLKIDRSFILEMHQDKKRELIVKAIIAMARSLKLKVIAEGIETAIQYQKLCSYGCHVFQGYYFSKPVKADEVNRFFHGK